MRQHAPGTSTVSFRSTSAVGVAVAIIVFATVAFALIRYRARDGRAPVDPLRGERVRGRGRRPDRRDRRLSPLQDLLNRGQGGRRFHCPGPHRCDRLSVGLALHLPGRRGQRGRQQQRIPRPSRCPATARISFSLRSADVIHAFWIPDERFKRDAIPGPRQPLRPRVSRAPGTRKGSAQNSVACATAACDSTSGSSPTGAMSDGWRRIDSPARRRRARGRVAGQPPTTSGRRRRSALASLFFFGLSGLLALLMRAELAQPGLQFVSDHTYDELFTMHGSGMIYLFLTPAALGLGLYLVPLQVGAAEIAAPRLALAGFWLYLCGGLAMYSGFLTDSGAGRTPGRRRSRSPAAPATPGVGMDLWVIGVGLAASAPC